MKHKSPKLKLLVLVLAFTAIGFSLFKTSRSTATAPRKSESAAASRQDKGTMIAELDFRPAGNGYGFRNYGRDHDNEFGETHRTVSGGHPVVGIDVGQAAHL